MTRKEKRMAQEANNSAQIALHKIDSLKNRVETLSKLNAEVSYISTHRYTILASGDIIYPKIFSMKIDSLMRLIEPDINKQYKLIEKLNK